MTHHIALVQLQHSAALGGCDHGIAQLPDRCFPGGISAPLTISRTPLGAGTVTGFLRHTEAALFHNAFLRDFLQEPGRQSRCRAAIQHTLPCMGNGQALLGAGDGNIAKPPLLFHFCLISNGPHSGEKSLFKAHQKYIGEFQALG